MSADDGGSQACGRRMTSPGASLSLSLSFQCTASCKFVTKCTLSLDLALPVFEKTFIFLDQVRLRQEYNALQVQPNLGSNSRPPDHDSTFDVTETPALTICPSGTRKKKDTYCHIILEV